MPAKCDLIFGVGFYMGTLTDASHLNDSEGWLDLLSSHRQRQEQD